MKTLLVGLGIMGAIAVAVLVVYTVNKPTPIPVTLPSPRPTLPNPSPAGVQVFEVAPADACSLSFTVAPNLVPGLNCVSKELYKDVAANQAGQYVLTNNKLESGYTLVPGEQYVYVINYKNSGTGAIGGTATDVLPAGVTYIDSSDGCTYTSSSRTITCTIGTTAANAASYAAVRFSVDSPAVVESLTNTAKITPTSGDTSTCSLTNPVKTPTPSNSPNPLVSPSPTPSASPATEARLDCVVKRAYEDNSSNSAGTYYLNNEIVDTATLSDGQTIVFNVVIRNTGNASVPDTKITDVLSSNLTFQDAENGCTYEASSRKVSCDVGSLAANTETSRSFRARIAVAGTTAIANTADVISSNGQRDSCSITVNAAGKVVLQPSPVPTELPQAGVFEVTAGTLGIGVLLLIAGALGLLLL